MAKNKEFEVHMLNSEGIAKAKVIADLFDVVLSTLLTQIPECREMSICKTKMEEACFFAKKAMAVDPKNQECASNG